MGNAVYPVLPGLALPVGRKPSFKTQAQRSVSGRELRATMQQYPLVTFSLNYEFLRDTAVTPEVDTLIGFFMARRASFDSFLFSDPDDNAVTAMSFGAGDGSTKVFQLSRAFGAGGFTFVEPVQNLNGAPSIYVGGVLKNAGTDYTISSTGLVTFSSAPANAVALTWTGGYYYRCRFLQDELDLSRFLQGLWEAKKVEFIGAIGNKV